MIMLTASTALTASALSLGPGAGATLTGALGLGLVLGLRHALEPDHVAALATLLPGERSARRAALRGALWGVGHGGTIALVGLPLVLLGGHVPQPVSLAAELLVALMLGVLGALALRRALRAPAPQAADGGTAPGAARPLPARAAAPVGAVHGLAGSGAAVALATAAAPSPAWAAAFLAVFALGSTASMAGAAALVTWPLRGASGGALRWVLGLSGVASLGVGAAWAALALVA